MKPDKVENLIAAAIAEERVRVLRIIRKRMQAWDSYTVRKALWEVSEEVVIDAAGEPATNRGGGARDVRG